MALRYQLHLSPATSETDLAARVADLGPEFTRLARLPNAIDTPNAPFVAGAEHANDPDPLIEALHILGPLVDRSTSVAVVGVDHWFIPCDPTPIRYQYLMRRRSDFTHEQYLARYRDIHSQFGFDTPGIEGYCQLHVDLERSATFAADCGIAFTEVDSVSELYLESVDTFFAALAEKPDVGAAATADEELFVDRPASQMYTSTVSH